MSDLPPFARAWLAQREGGSRAIARIEATELRTLDPVRALQLADALLGATPLDAIDPRRRASSGLVEQQRLFARARRGPR